jgi:hypothetical protein
VPSEVFDASAGVDHPFLLVPPAFPAAVLDVGRGAGLDVSVAARLDATRSPWHPLTTLAFPDR